MECLSNLNCDGKIISEIGLSIKLNLFTAVVCNKGYFKIIIELQHPIIPSDSTSQAYSNVLRIIDFDMASTVNHLMWAFENLSF